MLSVVAPALITSPSTWYRNSGSELHGGGVRHVLLQARAGCVLQV
jgi:hypothetical protein